MINVSKNRDAFKDPPPVSVALTSEDNARLEAVATDIRRAIVTMVADANSGHVGGSLSATELLVTLYHRVMRHDPGNPHWSGRDRYVQSKGHCTPVLYSTLASCGYFPAEDLHTFRRPGSHLQGHPHQLKTPGVEASTGTLGLGLSTACGMALAAKYKEENQRYFVLCGDGEQQEGQIWEAAMLGAKYKLSNLYAFTDRNMLQTDGNTEDVMPLEPLADKWKAFGWHTQVIDGHDKQGILDALNVAEKVSDQPHMIICNTIKGKGVSFMENEVLWHGNPPTQEQKLQALEELKNGI